MSEPHLPQHRCHFCPSLSHCHHQRIKHWQVIQPHLQLCLPHLYCTQQLCKVLQDQQHKCLHKWVSKYHLSIKIMFTQCSWFHDFRFYHFSVYTFNFLWYIKFPIANIVDYKCRLIVSTTNFTDDQTTFASVPVSLLSKITSLSPSTDRKLTSYPTLSSTLPSTSVLYSTTLKRSTGSTTPTACTSMLTKIL